MCTKIHQKNLQRWYHGFIPANFFPHMKKWRGYEEEFTASYLFSNPYKRYAIAKNNINNRIPDLQLLFGNTITKNTLGYIINQTLRGKSILHAAIGTIDNEEQTPLHLDLNDIVVLLISGSTGSGKTRLIYSILLSLMATTHPDSLNIKILDFKGDMRFFKGHTDYYDASNAERILSELEEKRKQNQQKTLESGKANVFEYNIDIVQNKLDKPFIKQTILIIDEVSELYTDPSYKQANENLVNLGRLGRSGGIRMILATQRPDIKSINSNLKSQAIHNIAFSARDQWSASVAGVAKSEEIRERGVCYVDSGILQAKVRTPFMEVEYLQKTLRELRKANITFASQAHFSSPQKILPHKPKQSLA